ncbi:MAG: VOC family protein [Proteobacteria bacterium]|nr:VOC family protein [Pseudomonadota bacterium]
MAKPSPIVGLRHLALKVHDLAACERFYVDLIGMQVDWRPDASNLYLTSGSDNLALHHNPAAFDPPAHQRLDHLGFALETPDQVDAWHVYLSDQGVVIKAAPRTHRDGSRSFYCTDPDGNTVQFICLPVPRR